MRRGPRIRSSDHKVKVSNVVMLSSILCCYLQEDLAVVLVDWSDGAESLNYLKAVQNMRVVGREIAKFVQLLHEYTALPYDKFHLIGHSLGAHAAGFAGQMQPGLGRISGNKTIIRDFLAYFLHVFNLRYDMICVSI